MSYNTLVVTKKRTTKSAMGNPLRPDMLNRTISFRGPSGTRETPRYFEKEISMKIRNIQVPVRGLSLARLLALAVLAANGSLFAQTDRGIIEGTLTDPAGAAVPNAKVQVINI